MFVIQRDDGAYVAFDPGRTGHSYTRNLQEARVYASRPMAEQDLCPGNERIVNLISMMEGNVRP